MWWRAPSPASERAGAPAATLDQAERVSTCGVSSPNGNSCCCISGSLTVNVQSSGLSLLAPTLTVYDAFQTQIGYVSGAGQYGTSLSLTVNGVEKQRAPASQMIFDIPAIIASLSEGLTLHPGDIIATGTPSGVALGMSPPQWLKPGDVVEAEIAGIGVLRNRVV